MLLLGDKVDGFCAVLSTSQASSSPSHEDKVSPDPVVHLGLAKEARQICQDLELSDIMQEKKGK